MKISGLTDTQFVHTVIRKRPKDIHKGDCGRILIAAGSQEMAGAAVFAAKAAHRCGSGLVNLCTVREIFPVIQISSPETICIQWEKAKEDLRSFDAIAAGPGMGVGNRTKEILERILQEYDKTIVIDADGLNTVAADEKLQQLVRNTNASVIITPHIGEARRLLGGQKADRRSFDGWDKTDYAKALTEKYGCITVIKGADTLVAVSSEEAYINTTGNPGMATAGSGDVLTGIITSLAGQGLTAGNAARAGVFVHGMSGDLAAEKLGEYGLVASDIANYLPFALKELTV